MAVSPMLHPKSSQWFVITPEGRQVGPVTTDLLVRGISANKVPRDALVARAGDPAWQEMLDVPEIFSALRALS